MNPNIECLVQALEELKVPYEFLDREKNFLRVGKAPYFYFSNHRTPLNDSSVHNICDDKEYTYYVLNSVLKMPKTRGYLDPGVIEEEYKSYLVFYSIEEILDNLEKEFSYPVIVKRNKGFLGINVFLCRDRSEAKSALRKIFNRDSRDFDYVALVQEYLNPVSEYRVIVLDKSVELVYKKDIANAKFEGNLSPLHYNGGKAVEITGKEKLEKIRKFTAPIFDELDLRYGGIDLAENREGEFSLIEINAYPGYKYFIRDNGKEKVVELYKKILTSINVAK